MPMTIPVPMPMCLPMHMPLAMAMCMAMHMPQTDLQKEWHRTGTKRHSLSKL